VAECRTGDSPAEGLLPPSARGRCRSLSAMPRPYWPDFLCPWPRMRGARPPFGDAARLLRTGGSFGECRLVGTQPRLQLHYRHRAGTGLCGPAPAGNLPRAAGRGDWHGSVRRRPSAEPRHGVEAIEAGFVPRDRHAQPSCGRTAYRRFHCFFRASWSNRRRQLSGSPGSQTAAAAWFRTPLAGTSAPSRRSTRSWVLGPPPCPFGARPPKPRGHAHRARYESVLGADELPATPEGTCRTRGSA
jgi:hypothetical protein